MSFYENITEFAGKPVVQYDPNVGIADPTGTIYRITVDWDASEAGAKWTDAFAKFLSDPASGQITGLVVGAWEDAWSASTEPIVEALVSASERFPNLTALFFGDVVSEESEISWLHQSDVSPIFNAFPKLEHFVVRGGTGLSLGRPQHPNLKSLIVQTGGLPASVVREVGTADLPALEHLELWLGSENYGGDATVEDMMPIISGTLFPKLTYLGLCDSEDEDEIAKAVAQAPILERVKTLDLSLGTLGDEGAEALLTSPHTHRLQKLDIHHHYCSPEVVARLAELVPELDADDRQEEEDDDRYAAVTE